VKVVEKRPVVELSPNFVNLLNQALAENPGVKAAMLGVYEGRQLQGNYQLRITGARLIPITDPNQSPNGTP
jgi:hypothetical protein